MPITGGAIQLANLPASTIRPIRLKTNSRCCVLGSHLSIEVEIVNIHYPLLAVQGLDDEYGTLERIRGIARRVTHAEIVELAHCGHSAHRDQAQELIRVTTEFCRANALTETSAKAGKYA